MNGEKLSESNIHPSSLAFKHFSHPVAVVPCRCSLKVKHLTFTTRVNFVDLVQLLCRQQKLVFANLQVSFQVLFGWLD